MSSLHCKCLKTRFTVCPRDFSFFFVKNETFVHGFYFKKITANAQHT